MVVGRQGLYVDPRGLLGEFGHHAQILVTQHHHCVGLPRHLGNQVFQSGLQGATARPAPAEGNILETRLRVTNPMKPIV